MRARCTVRSSCRDLTKGCSGMKCPPVQLAAHTLGPLYPGQTLLENLFPYSIHKNTSRKKKELCTCTCEHIPIVLDSFTRTWGHPGSLLVAL